MIQQVYGVYRTIIDPENTFVDALPLILNSNDRCPAVTLELLVRRPPSVR